MKTITGNPLKLTYWLKHQDINKLYDLTEHKKKRTKSQNSYCWELIGKIADAVGLSKEDVYIDMLRHYGQSEIVSMLSSINPRGYFKYYEEYKKGISNGKDVTAYKIYKGSSEFDTKEMTIFIDGIIQECKQLDIETLTPDEIGSMRLI